MKSVNYIVNNIYRNCNVKTFLSYSILFLLFIYPIASLTKLKIFYIYNSILFLFLVYVSFFIKKNIYTIIYSNWLIILFFLNFYFFSLLGLNAKISLLHSFFLSIYLVIFFLFIFANYHISPVEISYILSVLSIFYFILNIVLIVQFGNIRPYDRYTHESIGSYSNLMVGIVDVTIPYIFLLFYFSKNKIYYSIVLAIIFFNILISQSRASYLVLLLSLFLVFIFYSNSYKSFFKRFICFIFIIIFSILLVYILPITNKYINHTIDRIYNTKFDFSKVISNKDLNINDDQVTPRMVQYQMGIHTIAEYPFRGIGLGNYKYLMEENHGLKRIPHNFIFTIWTGSGLVGFIVFIILLIISFRNLWKGYIYFNRINIFLSYWFLTNFIALIILLFQGLFRPLLTNPIFYLPLAVGIMQSRSKFINKSRDL